MKQNIAVFVKNLTSGGAEKQAVLLAKALAGDYEMHYIIFNELKVHQKYLDLLSGRASEPFPAVCVVSEGKPYRSDILISHCSKPVCLHSRAYDRSEGYDRTAQCEITVWP